MEPSASSTYLATTTPSPTAHPAGSASSRSPAARACPTASHNQSPYASDLTLTSTPVINPQPIPGLTETHQRSA